jgi:hypothetical protein
VLSRILLPQPLQYRYAAALRSIIGLTAGMGIGWVSPRLSHRAKEIVDTQSTAESALSQVGFDVDWKAEPGGERADRLPRALERA